VPKQRQRAAFVTGGGSGIGRATAERLAAEGYVLGVFDVDAGAVATTTDRIIDAGGNAISLVGDVRDGRRVTEALEELDGLAPLWLAANVAGVGVAASAIETTDADWERVLSINLWGTFVVCRAALPTMIGHGGGVLINVASAGGLVGLARRAAYCASKAGVIGLTKAIAVDHAAQGIRSVAICPGTVETEWITKILAKDPDPLAAREAMSSRQLDGRMGSPEEVAGGIAFLASPEGRFVNGSEFVMDGGLTAR
jgi:NAD(P)-dependent dehydrogenase (short-subunit alcohol dehydrogenase family)